MPPRRPTRPRSPWPGAALLALLVCAAPAWPGAAADGENPSAVPPPAPALNDGSFVVPDVRTLPGATAAGVLARAGLNVGRVYDRRYPTRYVAGSVVRQRPEPGARLPFGAGVDLELMAEADGPPGGRAPDPAWPRVAAPTLRPTAPAPRPVAPAPAPAAPPADPQSPPAGGLPPPPAAAASGSGAPEVGPVDPGPPVPGTPAPPPVVAPLSPPPAAVQPAAPPPAASWPAPGPPAPAEPPPTSPPVAPATGPAPAAGSIGSPDAPAVAERARPGEVPDLLGLALSDAEQRAREAGLTLYVERVAGHPVGRVLEQAPAAGSARAAGSPIKVLVTAGGDFDGAEVPPPRVAVTRVTVPDLLDRTPLQAGRILADLGLAMKEQPAVNGLPGRVVDQKPAAGVEVEKGSVVSVWATPPAPAPPASARPAAPQPGPASPPPAPAPPPPGPAAPAAGLPLPVSPGEGTVLPKLRLLPVGFTWTPVEGAEAYILEVEELSGSSWISSLRKPVRTSAATLDVERIAVVPGDLRWRVRAVVGGREGTPCPWVTLR